MYLCKKKILSLLLGFFSILQSVNKHLSFSKATTNTHTLDAMLVYYEITRVLL
jgi:hypothetical protein